MIAGVLITLHGTTTITGGGTIACASPAAHKDSCAHLFNLSHPDITRKSMETASKIKRMLPATDSPSLKCSFVSKNYLIVKLQRLRDIDLKACTKKMHENVHIYRDLTKLELSSGTQYSISNLQPVPLQNRTHIMYILVHTVEMLMHLYMCSNMLHNGFYVQVRQVQVHLFTFRSLVDYR